MLDPRIYRMALLPVVLAVVVLAFSLSDQQGPLGTTLAPDAFSGAGAYTTMNTLAGQYPSRRPGSVGDEDLASYVAGQLRGYHFSVSTDVFKGQTIDGTRELENVVGVRAGLGTGSIVVVAHRDATGSPATAELSGTAVLLELARVLSGETQQRTVVLASTTGSVGAAGAARLAAALPQPVDAVLVLGDLAGASVREPVVVPWADGQLVAPPRLRNTVAAALGAQTGLAAGTTSLTGQIAHLALPMAASEQAPFGRAGEPAVLLSVSGERGSTPNEPTSPARITAFGRAVVQTLSALDGGPSIPRPSSYVSFSGKTIPAWAVRLLVLTLILPVLIATIDGLARARRRGHSITRWSGWVLAGAAPFALAALLVTGAKAVGLVGAPPGPVGGEGLTLHGGAVALLALSVVVIAGGLLWLRPFVIWLSGLRRRGALGDSGAGYGPGAAAALLLLLCLATLAIWLGNPFAALLLVPALHLWLWIVVPDVRLPVPAIAVMLAAGLAPIAIVALYYATTLGLGPLQVGWSWILLLAGGGVGLLTALEWSVVFGCAVGVIAIALRAAREPRPEDVPVTIRGPVTYAGPGSLGGTESALRR